MIVGLVIVGLVIVGLVICRSINSRSSDCLSSNCRSNDCRSSNCRSNQRDPFFAYKFSTRSNLSEILNDNRSWITDLLYSIVG